MTAARRRRFYNRQSRRGAFERRGSRAAFAGSPTAQREPSSSTVIIRGLSCRDSESSQSARLRYGSPPLKQQSVAGDLLGSGMQAGDVAELLGITERELRAFRGTTTEGSRKTNGTADEAETLGTGAARLAS